MSVPAPTLDVAIAGFGTVGRAVARLLCEGRHPSLRLAAICTRQPDAARHRAPWVGGDVFWTDEIDALRARRPGVLVELIGGVEPARSWIASALDAGLAVVTANKQVVAEHGPGLVSLARSCGSPFRFEAAVAGAVPVVRGLQDGLAGDRVTHIAGIVNGTCNYVLGRMTDDGVSLADAVREAQARGFAEADPAADLDGLDARAKLSILASIGFGSHVPPGGIPAGTIRGIDAGDIAAAASIGRVIRQVVWAGRPPAGAGAIAAAVGPALVGRDSWLGRARGPENVVIVRGERSGTTVFAGQGAGGDATAVAVVSDLLTLAHERSVPPAWPAASAAGGALDAALPRYVRVRTGGRGGLVDPHPLLAQAGITLDRTLEAPGRDGARWSGLLRPCLRNDLDRALAPLVAAGATGATVVSLPVVDVET